MKDNNFELIEGGDICSPSGFKASGIIAGLKKSGARDLALIFSDSPCIAAGTFTTCAFAAAPVQYCKEVLKKGKRFHAVVINSGNANACTGKIGLDNAREMARITSTELNIKDKEVLVCSTGRIGVQLPMDKIKNGIKKAAVELSPEHGSDASAAIMTTDTFPKKCAVSIELEGKTAKIAGIAKGAGMIAPEMKGLHATMICIITTDAAVKQKFLNKCVEECVEESFNRITVDGDMSTNDTVLVLANGNAGNSPLRSKSKEAEKFKEALNFVMRQLARQIVLDGEGAMKFVTIKVEKAASKQDAVACAKTVANSLLCKTAWFGGDPNWGRILAAAGRSGAKLKPEKFELYLDHLCAVRNGMGTDIPEEKLAEIMKNDEFTLRLVLNCGKASAEVWTNDISYEYVKINADYHT